MTNAADNADVREAAEKVTAFWEALDDMGIIGLFRDKLTIAATPAIVGSCIKAADDIPVVLGWCP